MTAELVAFLRARLVDDERIARAACIRSNGEVAERWQWVTTETDTPVPDHDLDEALSHQPVSLRSVEEFPAGSAGLLPSFVIHREEESAEGLPHIARHDPARVLRDVAAKRELLDLHPTNTAEPYRANVPGGMFYPPDPFYCDCQCDDGIIMGHEPCPTKRLLAQPYWGEPGWRDEWNVEA